MFNWIANNMITIIICILLSIASFFTGYKIKTGCILNFGKLLIDKLKAILIISFVLLPAFYFGYHNRSVETGLALVASALAIVFINLDKFQEFSGGGFSAKLLSIKSEASTLYGLLYWYAPWRIVLS